MSSADMGTGKAAEVGKADSGAKPAPPALGKKSHLSDDADAPPVKKVVRPTVSKATARAIWIGALLIAFAMLVGDLWGGRYQLVQASNSSNTFLYRIDTLTGRVHFCSQVQCVEVPVRAAAE